MLGLTRKTMSTVERTLANTNNLAMSCAAMSALVGVIKPSSAQQQATGAVCVDLRLIVILNVARLASKFDRKLLYYLAINKSRLIHLEVVVKAQTKVGFLSIVDICQHIIPKKGGMLNTPQQLKVAVSFGYGYYKLCRYM